MLTIAQPQGLYVLHLGRGTGNLLYRISNKH